MNKKISIASDELYPYFYVTDGTYGEDVKVTEELEERIKKAEKEFFDIQYILQKLVNYVS